MYVAQELDVSQFAACSMQQDDLRAMQAYVEVGIEQEPKRSNTVEWHVPLQSDK